ncbi:MAG TPA: HAMP domain-containing sensor histidine kinase [Micromonosporaceae bacterium]
MTGVRAQLNLLVVATTAVILAAFLAPLGLVLRNSTQQRAIAEATSRAQAAATLVALGQTPRSDEVSLTVFYGDGTEVGAGAQRGASVELASRGEAFSAWTTGGVEVLVPVQGLSTGTAVVRVFVPDAILHSGVSRSWLLLGMIGVGLVAMSLLIADRLGRRLVGSVTALAATADRLAAGDAAVRLAPSGPPEVRRVGAELNRLAARIEELLRAEREEVANLAHRLRTPLTALRLDVDAVGDAQDQARLDADVQALRREVDELIRTARRTVRSGVHARADLVAVVAERTAFWSALAEDSGRRLEVDIPAGPLPVGVPAQDLAAALDALLDNVFSHTPDGAPVRVCAAATAGGAILVVEDGGPGFSVVGQRGVSPGGSTGLGLDIARRTAEAAGGTVRLDTGQLGGALVELHLPLALI